MKKTLILMAIVFLLPFLLPSCATIAHKDVSTHWQGYGVDLEYKSQVAIPPEMIPEFIDAVTRLERLIDGMEK